jgi:hypothetical protein
MRPSATLRLQDGRTIEVGHGDLIGRLWSAAVYIDDPRISEAHALISLRGDALKLLALRGRFAVGGRPVSEVTLLPGLEVTLGEGLTLHVEHLVQPEVVLGLRAEGMPARMLPGTCSLVVDPEPSLAPPSHPGALAIVWSSPDGWRLRPTGGAARPLVAGDQVTLGGRTWTALEIGTHSRVDVTHTDPYLEAPLRIVARYDTVHLFAPDRAPAVLAGLSARLISELVAFGQPVPWATLAEELWPGGGNRKQLDMALLRLRSRLKDERIRADLVRTDGRGTVELFLRPGDVLDEQI